MGRKKICIEKITDGRLRVVSVFTNITLYFE
jgi:hypothetical protein